MIIAKLRSVLLFSAALFLSSCSVLPPLKTTPVSTYTISQWPKNKVVSTSSGYASPKTILVATPIASPGYTSSNMIYVTVPYQLRSFSSHVWVAPPAELLLPLIANRIRSMHYFQAVVTSPFAGKSDTELTMRLLTLQQEFLQPTSRVRLIMEATLINTTTGQVIASRVFKAVVDAPGNNPYSGVLATNTAANRVAGQIA